VTWDAVLFDLDGTITHSEAGVAGGVRYALDKLGYPPEPEDQMRRFLGPTLYHSFGTTIGMPEPQAREAVRLYREYYDEVGAYEAEVFPGIPELLTALNQAGKNLAIATSKVEYAAVAVLRHFNLDHHFDVIVGAGADESVRGTKGLVVEHALAELRLCDGARAVMVGDREHDIHGAAENGLPAIGVRYGYSRPGELEEAGALQVVDTVAQLSAALLATSQTG
jgi:phosphoglycolate phosphatase